MSFAADQAASQALIYGRFGFAALWEGVDAPVTVLVDAPEVVERFGNSRAVLATTVIKVRVSEVAAPAFGQTVTVTATDDTPEVSYRLTAEPRFDAGDVRRTEWFCEAEAV